MNNIDVFSEKLRDYANSHGLVYEFSTESFIPAATVKFIDRSRNIDKYFKVDFLEQHPVAAADIIIREMDKILANKAKKELNSRYGVDKIRVLSIKQVIFHDPATIIYWTDGTRTVVKCQDGDIYDPEKGLAMAISKKALGNNGNYCNVFKQWLPEDEVETLDQRIIDAANKIVQSAFGEWRREHQKDVK